MAIEKIKVSSLDPVTSLRGFFALGVDKDNESAKADLGFVEEAADNANASASNANEAADNANISASNANEAADNANTSASNANEAADNANTSASNANEAADNANTSVENMQGEFDKLNEKIDRKADLNLFTNFYWAKTGTNTAVLQLEKPAIAADNYIGSSTTSTSTFSNVCTVQGTVESDLALTAGNTLRLKSKFT
ncbi:MAG: hypothetical protein ACRCZB_04285, partial [Bacteroidales bacterium]